MNRSEAVLLGITVIWGTTFPVMKVSLEYIPPILFLAYRFGIASALMLLLFRGRVLQRETLLEGFLLGLTLFFGNGLQIIGLKYTTASNSAFITSLYVVFTPFIAYYVLGSRVKGRDFAALSIALLGLYLISGTSMNFGYGDLLTSLCAVSFAFQIVLVEKFRGEDYLSLAFWQIFWNFILALAYASVKEGFYVPKAAIAWGGIIYTGVFATVLTFTLQTKFQRYTKAHRAALIYSAEPIFGYISSFIALGEVLSPAGYLGALLILAAIWYELRGS
ncbi:DMT family transporter [Thermococcus sp.]|uniref:DMT family transporter n=1 Tax=Thermococcus sp. TaxID=35749 RepID=UPI002630D06A|nr:DMT family transporter [Thermococcus sp.]